MSYDTSLFDHDVGYYEFLPNNWLPGKIVPGGSFAWTQKAIDAAVNLDLKDTDVIIATYPKTGMETGEELEILFVSMVPSCKRRNLINTVQFFQI